MPLFLLRIPFSSKIFISFEKSHFWDVFIITDSAIWTESVHSVVQCHSLLSFQACFSICAPLKAIFLGRSVLMLWYFSVPTNSRLVFQHSQVHDSLVVLYWLLHPFLFLGHHLPHRFLHCNLTKSLFFAIGMQVQWTIYCLKPRFFDQVLLMHHQ